MPKKEEIIAGIQETADGLGSTLYFLPELQQPGSLSVRADMLESFAQDLLTSAHDLRTYAGDLQELQQAVQNAKNNGAL